MQSRHVRAENRTPFGRFSPLAKTDNPFQRATRWEWSHGMVGSSRACETTALGGRNGSAVPPLPLPAGGRKACGPGGKVWYSALNSALWHNRKSEQPPYSSEHLNPRGHGCLSVLFLQTTAARATVLVQMRLSLGKKLLFAGENLKNVWRCMTTNVTNPQPDSKTCGGPLQKTRP